MLCEEKQEERRRGRSSAAYGKGSGGCARQRSEALLLAWSGQEEDEGRRGSEIERMRGRPWCSATLSLSLSLTRTHRREEGIELGRRHLAAVRELAKKGVAMREC